MFGSYLQGFIGLIVALIGVVVLIIGIVNQDGFIVIGFLMMFGGGYLRYLSRQTSRTGDSLLVRDNQPIQMQQETTNRQFTFRGSRDIDDHEFQLYLVEKYKIEKNTTLEKFVFERRPYNTLAEALAAAAARDNAS